MLQSIFSPIPGVFYRKPSPQEEVFVVENQQVKVGDTLGIIEVMKNFYEIKAEYDGVLVEFKVHSEDVVDVGQEIAIIRVESAD